MEFDFPKKKYVGISKLISHVSQECQDLILWMLTYNPDNRPTASQTIKHNYFKDLRDVDTQRYVAAPPHAVPYPGSSRAKTTCRTTREGTVVLRKLYSGTATTDPRQARALTANPSTPLQL